MSLLSVEDVYPCVSLGLSSLHDDFLMFVSSCRSLESLLVQTHGRIGSFLGAVLSQLGESKEEVSVAVKIIF